MRGSSFSNKVSIELEWAETECYQHSPGPNPHQVQVDWRAAMQSTRTQNYRDPKRWNTVSVPERVAERAHTKCQVNEDGCWVSAYSVASHGYAQIGWQNGGKRHAVLAHRASWTHANGQVPIGMTLDHTCKNRRCVNPAHLRLLPNWENARRNQGDDWKFGTCRNGHADTNLQATVRSAKSGKKYEGLVCRVCRAEYNRKWRESHPDKYKELTKRGNEKRKAAA